MGVLISLCNSHAPKFKIQDYLELQPYTQALTIEGVHISRYKVEGADFLCQQSLGT